MQDLTTQQEDFVQRCMQKAQLKKNNLEENTVLLELLNNLIEKIGALLEKTEEGYPILQTNNGEISHWYAEHTVFDAIPLNRANLEILCTPWHPSVRWQLEANNTIPLFNALCDDIEKIQNMCIVEHSSEQWEFSEDGVKKKTL